jgi:rhodanese-related sulfurtransferase
MELITREELHAKLERGDEFRLVMTLAAPAFGQKHIPRSLCVESAAEALTALDREEEIVVYCADVACAASIYAYFALEREGFRRVRRYPGGVADWEAAGYPLETGEPPQPRRKRVPPKPRRATTANRVWRPCF